MGWAKVTKLERLQLQDPVVEGLLSKLELDADDSSWEKLQDEWAANTQNHIYLPEYKRKGYIGCALDTATSIYTSRHTSKVVIYNSEKPMCLTGDNRRRQTDGLCVEGTAPLSSALAAAIDKLLGSNKTYHIFSRGKIVPLYQVYSLQ